MEQETNAQPARSTQGTIDLRENEIEELYAGPAL
jgi:hypothetical protein